MVRPDLSDTDPNTMVRVRPRVCGDCAYVYLLCWMLAEFTGLVFYCDAAVRVGVTASGLDGGAGM